MPAAMHKHSSTNYKAFSMNTKTHQDEQKSAAFEDALYAEIAKKAIQEGLAPQSEVDALLDSIG